MTPREQETKGGKQGERMGEERELVDGGMLTNRERYVCRCRRSSRSKSRNGRWDRNRCRCTNHHRCRWDSHSHSRCRYMYVKGSCTWSCTHIGLVCLSAASSSVGVGRRLSSMGAEKHADAYMHGREDTKGWP